MRNSILTELYRKSIHLSSLLIPLSYKYLLHYNKKLFFTFLLPLAAATLIIELFRLQNRTFKRIFFNMFGLILRKHEHNDFTGATYLIISSIFSIAIFSPDIAFIALSFLSIGDTVAAIVGKSQGKRQFLKTPKSLEGSLACFVATFSFAIFFIHPLLAFFGAVTATIAEATEIPLDDNIKIPIMSGIIMQLLLFFT